MITLESLYGPFFAKTKERRTNPVDGRRYRLYISSFSLKPGAVSEFNERLAAPELKPVVQAATEQAQGNLYSGCEMFGDFTAQQVNILAHIFSETTHGFGRINLTDTEESRYVCAFEFFPGGYYEDIILLDLPDMGDTGFANPSFEPFSLESGWSEASQQAFYDEIKANPQIPDSFIEMFEPDDEMEMFVMDDDFVDGDWPHNLQVLESLSQVVSRHIKEGATTSVEAFDSDDPDSNVPVVTFSISRNEYHRWVQTP